MQTGDGDDDDDDDDDDEQCCNMLRLRHADR